MAQQPNHERECAVLPETKKRVALAVQVVSYLMAAYAILLFLDGWSLNDRAAVILLFCAVGVRLGARYMGPSRSDE